MPELTSTRIGCQKYFEASSFPTSHPTVLVEKMTFLSHWWDMLVPWRVSSKSTQSHLGDSENQTKSSYSIILPSSINNNRISTMSTGAGFLPSTVPTGINKKMAFF